MKEKFVSLSEAISRIPSGSRVALGGNIMRRQPNAAVREMIRQSIGDLTVYTFATGVSVDMLAAAGLLHRYEGVYVGLFWHGLAPNFRRAVEAGKVEVRDFSESTMVARFQAACAGVGFFPTKAILGTDMMGQDASIVTEMTCPFTGDIYAAVRAIDAEFTVMHGYRADKFGNVQWPLLRDSDDVDQIIARGSKRLIVTVEEIVDHSEIMEQPNLTYIPSQWVEAVVHVPFGGHPLACDTIHDEDVDHIRDFAKAGSSPEAAQAYLNEFVRTAGHEEYLRKFGGLEALRKRLGVVGGAA
ncbi:CoA transferase subunit A [Rhizobium sp. P32RR-XVIII]|uniref:CoA transferase subunit A n=1 Tax=Rhizobium sp. P32RR-XVIII TaxID=2726738 RepID=UPI001456D25D|nr:CoA transferase subunit A [Rhizobium sp. P32RR-XVIII]NLS07349.1 CoA transferase subunit A [Rhizobium sp. P32RR-XVIII]